MQLSKADEVFCRIMATRLRVGDREGADLVLDCILRRANPVIDLREAYHIPGNQTARMSAATKNATELARELGVRPIVVLDAIYELRIPMVGRGRRYELTDEQVRQITARIGVAP